ncbi:MAG TPA: hypothetical protein VJH34_03085 [archaeon]|nr:hypothetical protein [archaeon]
MVAIPENMIVQIAREISPLYENNLKAMKFHNRKDPMFFYKDERDIPFYIEPPTLFIEEVTEYRKYFLKRHRRRPIMVVEQNVEIINGLNVEIYVYVNDYMCKDKTEDVIDKYFSHFAAINGMPNPIIRKVNLYISWK